MAKNAYGILVYFDEKRRRELIKEGIDNSYEPFSDALGVHEWKIGQLSIALLSFSESSIDYIALAKKGKRVVTSKFRTEFSDMVNLRAVSIDAIEKRLSEGIRQHFIRSSKGVGGPVPEKTWTALIEAIKFERPYLSNEIDRLLSLRRYSGYSLSGKAAEVLLQEREALGASLDIFSGNNQLRARVLSAWAPHEDSVSDIDEGKFTAKLTKLEQGNSSFLKGIPKIHLKEEPALQHDLFNWKGITPFHEAGISVFEQGNRRLEIVYANRNKLEHTFGNAPRYLTNTEFTQGIHRGWIGTSGVQSQNIKNLIKQYYETGRAVLVAHETNSANGPLNL